MSSSKSPSASSSSKSHKTSSSRKSRSSSKSSRSRQKSSSAASRSAVSAKSRQRAGGSFDFNCQHYLRCLLPWLLVIILVLLLFWAFRKPKKPNKEVVTIQSTNTIVQERIKVITQSIDSAVNPCDDFHEHACAKYERRLRRHDVMASAYLMFKNTSKLLSGALLNGSALERSHSKAVGALAAMYGACMREWSGPKKAQIENVLRGMARVTGVPRWPLLPGDSLGPTQPDWFFDSLAELHLISDKRLKLSSSPEEALKGLPLLFWFVWLPSLQNEMMLDMHPTGLLGILVNPKESPEDNLKELRRTLTAITFYFVSSHASKSSKAQQALFEAREEIVRLIVRLLEAPDWSAQEMKFYSSGSFSKAMGLDWTRLINQILNDSSITADTRIHVPGPFIAYFQNLSRLLTDSRQIRVVKNFFGALYLWETMDATGLGRAKESTHNQQMLNHDTCLRLCLDGTLLNVAELRVLVDAFRQQNLTKHERTLRKVNKMASHIKRTYRAMLQEVSTNLPSDIRTLFISKMDSIKSIIGYESWILNDSQLDAHYDLEDVEFGLGANATFLEHFHAFRRHMARRIMRNATNIRATIPPFVDKSVSVNLPFYKPDAGVMVMPMASMQYPLYDPESLAEINYGSYGLIIGHELTHAYTMKSLPFIPELNESMLLDWKQNGLDDVLQCFANQSAVIQEEITGMQLNGSMTTDEDIADHVGIKVAYRAWQSSRKSSPARSGLMDPAEYPLHTPAKLFFYAYALSFCDRYDADAIERRIKTDVHNLNKYRINLALANFDAFASTFKCSAGSPMNPTKKCTFF